MIPLINTTTVCSCGSMKSDVKLFCEECWTNLPLKTAQRINYFADALQNECRDARAFFARNQQSELK